MIRTRSTSSRGPHEQHASVLLPREPLVEHIAYRCAAWDTPFWVDANPIAGRFNRAGEAPTSYLGLHPLTPWAELLRFLDIRDEASARGVRPPLWTARVVLEESETVDLSFDTAADFGIDPEDLVADDWHPCQALAAGLRLDPAAPKAIVTPSAALPGTRNLVLLGERVISPMLMDPIDIAVDTPASIATVRGRAPTDLLDLVQYQATGIRHPGFEAWEAGYDYTLEEPQLRAEEIALS